MTEDIKDTKTFLNLGKVDEDLLEDCYMILDKRMVLFSELRLSNGNLMGKVSSAKKAGSFYADPKVQAAYEKRVRNKREALKRKFNTDYDDALHLNMIKQVVRSELTLEQIERQHPSNRDSTVMDQLRREREHAATMTKQLNISMETIRTKNDTNVNMNSFVILQGIFVKSLQVLSENDRHLVSQKLVALAEKEGFVLGTLQAKNSEG